MFERSLDRYHVWGAAPSADDRRAMMPRMLPDGYVGLVVCDTRRAIDWERGLRAAGFDVVRVEAAGRDADKGGWQIGVTDGQGPDARAFVTDVVAGRTRLRPRPQLPRFGWAGLIGAFVVLVALLLAALLRG